MKPKIFGIATVVVVLGLAIFVSLNALHKTVVFSVDGSLYPVAFWGRTVTDALTHAQLVVFEGDQITPGLDAPVNDGDAIMIDRAVWGVIQADGVAAPVRTAEKQISTLLAARQVHLGPHDLLLYNGVPIDPAVTQLETGAFTLQVVRATRIAVNDAGRQVTIWTTAPTLGGALAEAEIQLYEADHISPTVATVLDGTPLGVTISRSREVWVQSQHQTVRTRLHAETVGAALAAVRMPLQGLDYSIPAETDPIPADGLIRYVNVTEEIVLAQETIPYGLQYQASDQVDLDTQKVLQVGEYGITAQRIRVVYADGEEISRNVEDTWLAKSPQDEIVGYGTRINIQTAQTADGPIEYWRKVEVYATSYSPCNIGIPGQCGATTASGKTPQKGMIAVIRSWYNQMQGLPVYVSNYGFATIEDLGAGIAGQDWIDLAFSDEEYSGWSGHVTLYFLTPVPANVMWVLE